MQLTLDPRTISFASKVIEPHCEVGDVKMGSISEFIERNFRHFNAAVLKDAADAYIAHLDGGGKMMITLAGAVSNGPLCGWLAGTIRPDQGDALTWPLAEHVAR